MRHSKKKQRLVFILLTLLSVSAGIGLLLWALEENMMYFLTPSELLTKPNLSGKAVRIGGLVEEGSLKIDPKSLMVNFYVKDETARLKVQYQGVLPTLFREKQGVVMEGILLGNGTFKAHLLLAKHDETYRPPEKKQSVEKNQLLKSLKNES